MTKKETIYGTIQENLDVALLEEEFMKACGPFDPYYRIAKTNLNYYLECAAALERGETEIEPKW
ncbi:hypothetical protein Ab1vBOLIVR5_gp125 [Agrobacterium phage OLIVR5]|uniref:Uncharacterized protein n=1 Tax=Agrobacterium phage OLIVR5 TaxID=2723773 RepID=A0A858MTC3_9CAUD|nr:hypothetical protein KNU99_gp125 [Agrobacterium phage OLIVR5]QIW87773.1 hypothetical protein Ab1vBOLIVR5_gp125 [Agrobacterium phage OLIVR5]QIW88037.1 hypothetical protein Ab1vBOLIVR6_gp130 [Agrobacterium phage OLIVR6]